MHFKGCYTMDFCCATFIKNVSMGKVTLIKGHWMVFYTAE